MVSPMYALRLHDRSQALNLVYEQAPEPLVGIGDALVRVHAASFTPTETRWPCTWVDRSGRSRVPTIPSHEVSGVVESLGDGSFGVSVGQEVYGLTDWYRDGAAAELVAVEASNLAPKPTTLTHDEPPRRHWLA
jgi:NADPH:quinone reductase-like Zn-dependent oxidoreductase